MCCRPLTSRLNHFERPCVLFTLSHSHTHTLSLSHSDGQLTHEKVKEGGTKWFHSETSHTQTDTHTSSREHHTPMCTCSLVHFEHTHTHTVGRGGGRSGLEVVKGAVCYVMEGRNGFALSDRAVTTALFHV